MSEKEVRGEKIVEETITSDKRKEIVESNDSQEVVEEKIEVIEELIAKSTYKILLDELTRLLREDIRSLKRPYPPLINKAFFYVRPHERFLESWLKKWGEIVLIYCGKNNKFVVSLDELAVEFPFSSTKLNKSLSRDDLKKIVGKLVESGKAKWLDTKQEVALIYWISPSYIIDRILLHSREIGFKYITLHLLDKVFPDLPLEEKIALLNTIVTKNKGVWIKKNYAIRLNW